MASLVYISDNVIAHGIYPHLCFTELVRFCRLGARYHRIMRRPEVMAYYLSDPKRALDVICRIYHDRLNFNILDIYLWLKAYLNYFEADQYHPFISNNDLYHWVVHDGDLPLIDACLHFQKNLGIRLSGIMSVAIEHEYPHVVKYLLDTWEYIPQYSHCYDAARSGRYEILSILLGRVRDCDHVRLLQALVSRARDCTGTNRAVFDVIYPYVCGKDVTEVIELCRQRRLEYFAEALSTQ